MVVILETLLLLLFGFVSLILIGIVLIQKGRGGGLASAFGGGSGTATAFGSKTGDVLTWATSVIFGVFLLLAIILNLIANFRSPPPVVGGLANPPVGPDATQPVPITVPVDSAAAPVAPATEPVTPPVPGSPEAPAVPTPTPETPPVPPSQP